MNTVQARRQRERREARWDMGEGSRGGHIVGHTSSGKPIYGTGHPLHNTPSGVLPHKRFSALGYSSKDHKEAAAHHYEQARAANDQSTSFAKKHNWSPEKIKATKKKEQKHLSVYRAHMTAAGK